MQPHDRMTPNSLVVYFSRTGNTKQIAEQIAAALGAELDPIIERTSRAGVIGYLRSGYQAFARRLVEIDTRLDPGAYDLVVIGTPIWDASLSSPVRSYLRHHRAALREVAFFCTCGGMGSDRVFAQMRAESGKAPRGTLVVREGDLRRSSDAVARFVAKLGARPPAPEAPPPAAARV